MNGETAQARRYYHHVKNGGRLRADDVSRMVQSMEGKDMEIQRLQDIIVKYREGTQEIRELLVPAERDVSKDIDDLAKDIFKEETTKCPR